MAITLTEAAASRVRDQLASRGHGIGLRVGVRKTGCSGYAWVVNFADEVAEDDRVFESRGIQVVVAEETLGLIDGTEVDYTRHGLNEAFSFRNPKAASECGCGESFGLEGHS